MPKFKLRGHHLKPMRYFFFDPEKYRDVYEITLENYGEEFLEFTESFFSLLDGDDILEIIDSDDIICENCPLNGRPQCYVSDGYDEEVILSYGLSLGEALPFSELRKILRSGCKGCDE